MAEIDIAGLTAWRRHLHAHPEISGEESWTAAEVSARMAALDPDDLVTGLGGAGLLVRFTGSAPKRRILLRCELDALPIPEANGFDHRSQIAGKGHLCGHDGHMAILTGVAEALARRRIDGADVLLLFQPAEETGAGAAAVLQDPRFAAFAPDLAIALHNVPGLPVGQVEVKPGPTCCASRGLKIRLSGRTAHASQPETGLSPASAMVEILSGIAALNSPRPAEGPPARMATLTHASLGEPTFGVAPGAAEVFVTLRTVLDADMAALCREAEALVSKACAGTGIGAVLSWHDVFPAMHNDAEAAALVMRAVQAAGLACRAQPQPMRWSEDFAHFGGASQAALFLLGAGEHTPALHNPDYDFPDALIAPGLTAFLSILEHAVR